MRKLITLAILLFSIAVHAQSTGKLTLHGKVKHKRSNVNNVTIEVYKDNEVIKRFHNLKSGAYKLELFLGHVYNITFTKDGYVEKSVAVVAKPNSATKVNGRFFFQLDIELFTLLEQGEDDSVIPPVAKLYIKNQKTGFTYDKKYVKWIAGHYDD